MQSIINKKVLLVLYIEVMMEYFSKASHVYLKIATDCLEEKKTP